jgi:hypothetical protein
MYMYSYTVYLLNMGNADPPRANLVLGRRFTAEEIREGSNVYLECQTRSNPPIQRLTWMHNVRKALSLSILLSFSFSSQHTHTCVPGEHLCTRFKS